MVKTALVTTTNFKKEKYISWNCFKIETTFTYVLSKKITQ
jgi:hypothetical protein